LHNFSFFVICGSFLKEYILDLLLQITELSHQFGTSDYVKGGGGNTSVKDETTIWVKPSGTTLAEITPKMVCLFNIFAPAKFPGQKLSRMSAGLMKLRFL
jgi:ribulose-5-phosphate 4-epimerase/fuculose-1-phosphate aldolase